MNTFLRVVAQIAFVVVLDALVVGLIYYESEQWKVIQANAKAEATKPVTMIDPRTGLELHHRTRLIMGDGYPVVERECAQCHPTQIIRSFRADRAEWLDAIRWMQAEKGLKTFDSKTEDTILTYLENYYGK